MTTPVRAARAAWVFVAAVAISSAGCGGDKTADAVSAKNQSNIQRISNLYAAFQNAKNGRGPKDENELRQFVTEYAPDKLAMMGINTSNVDGLLTSERDGEKFHIRYAVGGGRGSVDPVVFEKAGKDGKKQVGFTGGTVEDADESTYKELLAGKRKEPPGAAPNAGPGGPNGRPGGGIPAGAPKGPKG